MHAEYVKTETKLVGLRMPLFHSLSVTPKIKSITPTISCLECNKVSLLLSFGHQKVMSH